MVPAPLGASSSRLPADLTCPSRLSPSHGKHLMSDMGRRSPDWSAGHCKKGLTESGEGLWGWDSMIPKAKQVGPHGKCHLSPTALVLSQLCLRASVWDFTAQIQLVWLWDGSTDSVGVTQTFGVGLASASSSASCTHGTVLGDSRRSPSGPAPGIVGPEFPWAESIEPGWVQVCKLFFKYYGREIGIQ